MTFLGNAEAGGLLGTNQRILECQLNQELLFSYETGSHFVDG